MPHIALVPFTGLRVKEQEMLDLGMSLPSLGDRAAEISHLPALGLLTLAGLTPEAWTQSYHESNLQPPSLAEEIIETRPTLVAISTLTASINEAYQLATRIRESGIPVVLGGLHATACPREAQRFCNAVVVGKGESVWLEVLSDAKAGQLKTRYQADKPFNLGRSPTPRLDLLPPGRRNRMTLQTQRGCPFACDFCGASRLLGSFREKPTETIEQELKAIMRVDSSRLIELADDNTFAGKRDFDRLFEVFSRYNLKYFTEADWRIGEKPKLLKKLSASGCVQVLVGVESLVFSHSGMGSKESSLDRMMNAIAAIQEHGVAVIGCFIVGSDGETQQTIDKLAEFLLDANLADIQLTLLTPFPGTALHDRMKMEGRLLADRDWSYYTLFDVTYQPDRMTVAELEDGFKQLLMTVFNQDAVAKRSKLKKRIWKNNLTKCD